jgi:hypothetical protein
VERGEGQLHLRLDAGRPDHLAPAGIPSQVVKQGCLADASLAVHHEGLAGVAADLVYEPVEHGALHPAVDDEDCLTGSFLADHVKREVLVAGLTHQIPWIIVPPVSQSHRFARFISPAPIARLNLGNRDQATSYHADNRQETGSLSVARPG